jgi:hypothetical protein
LCPKNAVFCAVVCRAFWAALRRRFRPLAPRLVPPRGGIGYRREKQIPFGNDRKKNKSKGKGNSQ